MRTLALGLYVLTYLFPDYGRGFYRSDIYAERREHRYSIRYRALDARTGNSECVHRVWNRQSSCDGVKHSHHILGEVCASGVGASVSPYG